MTWLTWRQFRLPAVAGFGIVTLIAVVLAITASSLDVPGQGADYLGQLPESTDALYYGGLVAIYVIPGLAGAFWGAPLVARELETGTHRLVWNQTITRTRWLATKLGIGGLAAMAVAGVSSLIVGWWAAPIDTAMESVANGAFGSRITPLVFAARGIVPIGYAAFAFALGVTAGIVLRRTVVAMAVTLVVFTLVQILVPTFVRPNIIAPAHQDVTITNSSIRQIGGDQTGKIEHIRVAEVSGVWMLGNETVDPSGNATGIPAAVNDCMPQLPRTAESVPPDINVVKACLAQLDALGYKQRLTFQPGDRFWPLQWIESGIFLALAGLLTWFSFRWTRHRLS
jgi:ABC-type transport system involved in multi-copper enzyme maturation permease subunit